MCCVAARFGRPSSTSACCNAKCRKCRTSSQRFSASLKLSARWQARARRSKRSLPASSASATAVSCSSRASRASAASVPATESASSLLSNESRMTPRCPSSDSSAPGSNANGRSLRSSPSMSASLSFPAGAARISCTARTRWSPRKLDAAGTCGPAPAAALAAFALPDAGAATSSWAAHSRSAASAASMRSSRASLADCLRFQGCQRCIAVQRAPIEVW
mmetsp:Transcript_83695/g.231960  ORF Transcript_83695/g.231960 Transcript_83695/m.231960 type:complete len:219 (+) Transcript_83695:350-1006(+)